MKWSVSWSAKIERAVIVVLLLAAIFLRFYHFTDTMLFQGDQGRDAMIVADIFRQHDLVFIGPVTSIGNIYLGPFYYYFMLPFLFLTYPSPTGPAIAVALISIGTVFCLYKFGQEIVGKRAALLAAFFYTFAVEIVRHSRFSWNPNLTPPVTFFMFYCLYQAWKKNVMYWLGVAICFSILVQLHYMTLVTLGGAGLIWLWQLREILIKKEYPKLRKFIIVTLASVAIFLVSLTPLVLFDVKHDGVNRKALAGLFTQDKAFTDQTHATASGKLATFIGDWWSRTQIVFFNYNLTSNKSLEMLLLLGMIGLIAVYLYVYWKKRKTVSPALGLFLCFLIPALIGIGAYQGELYPHYVIFLFPIIFLLWGWLLAPLSRHLWGKPLVALFVIWFLVFSLPREPLTGNGWGIVQMKALTDNLITHLKPNEKYNIVLLSPTKDIYGPHYRYFLSTTDHPAVAEADGPSADTLVVINEDAVKDVASLPIYEIVVFPNKVPSEVYTIPNGPEITIFRK